MVLVPLYRDPQGALVPPVMRTQREKRALYEPESMPCDTESADALNLDALASQNNDK